MVRRAEDGPVQGGRLRSDDRHRVGACARTAAEVLAGLDLPLEAIVVASTVGDPVAPLDPHGTLRRVVHRAFEPPRGTTMVSAGDRTVAAGLMESILRLRDGAERVGLVVLDWVPASEVAVVLALSRTDGVSLSPPRLSRCSPTPLRGREERSSVAGAFRLVEALEASVPARDVMLDREPRDGIAWTVQVDAQQS